MKLDQQERAKMIEDLVLAMEDWDEDTIMWWAKERMNEILNECTDEELTQEYVYQILDDDPFEDSSDKPSAS
jgi:hypothetical protein